MGLAGGWGSSSFSRAVEPREREKEAERRENGKCSLRNVHVLSVQDRQELKQEKGFLLLKSFRFTRVNGNLRSIISGGERKGRRRGNTSWEKNDIHSVLNTVGYSTW